MDERALARAGDAGHGDEHAERDVDGDVAQVVQRRRARPAARPSARAPSPSACGRSAKWRPVSVSEARRPATSPSKTTVPPCVPAPGPMSTTWSAIAITCGSCSTTSTVLPLSRSAHQQPVDALHVVRVQADRRLVEDVRDVGQARAEVADHLDPLRLAARQRRRLAVEAQVAEADLDEAVERVAQQLERRGDARRLDPGQERARSSTCIDAHSAMLRPSIRAASAAWLSRAPPHSGHGSKVATRSIAARTCGCGGLDVLGQERALEAVDEPFVLEVQAADLDLLLGAVQELLPLVLRCSRRASWPGRSGRTRRTCATARCRRRSSAA